MLFRIDMWSWGLKFACVVSLYAAGGSILWAQQEARTLWDFAQDEALRPWMSDRYRYQISGIFSGLIPLADLNRMIHAADSSDWEVVRRILRQYRLSTFQSFQEARGSRSWSSERLAVSLHFYSQVQESSALFITGRPDTLGFFWLPRGLVEGSGRLEALYFHSLGLEVEWGILLGLSQNSQVQYAHPEVTARYSWESYIRQLVRVAQTSDFEGLQAGLMASLVNPQSTQRLNEMQMRTPSPLRNYQFQNRLSDGIFQLLALSPDQLRNFVLSGELPANFVRPKSKSFDRIVQSFKAEAIRRQLRRVSDLCGQRASSRSL